MNYVFSQAVYVSMRTFLPSKYAQQCKIVQKELKHTNKM